MLNIPMLILLPLWLALIPFHALAASGLTVKLLDHISEAGLAGQEVHAYEKGGDGSLVWKTKRVTDGGGLAKFDLEGLGEGKTYVFNAQPYGYWVKSEEVTATGWYSFRVGHLQVRVIDGVTEQPKAGQAVVLKRWQADGNHVGVMNATTDAEGWLKLDPPNLGQVGYVVTAISPTDGQWKTSETYWVKGPHRFVLGNAVVEAKLRDGISGEGLVGQWMEVWEKLSTGNRVLREKRWTDGTGSIKFDLAGMKEGRRYVLKAQPYLDAVESGEISQSGPQELKAGKLRITLVDGRDGQGYGWRDVDLLERQADGSLKGVRSYKTDGEGRLRLDPAQLGVKDQVIRAVSLVDGSVKESPGYARGGDYSFKVGGSGLTVKLLDHISEAGLAGQEVHAYEKGGDGSLVWKTKRVTDGGGLAKFDLEGLGEGKTYVFNAQPYGYWVKSEEVTATGWYSFRVGHLQVRVIDGVTEQPKAGQAVVLKRWQADGNHVGVMNATTDAEGWLKLDPPNLGQVGYVVTAISPTDGQWKTSETYWVKGPHRFVLGNAVVEAKLRDGISGEGLVGQWMEVWEKLSTGNRVLREKRWTDGTGSIKFDLAGMKEGRRYVLKAQPYLDAVESGEISQSGPQELKAGKLRITLVDGRDGQGYGWRDVDLLERQADGSLKGVRSYKTDGEGRLRLDPAQLGVKDQVIRAVSLVDGSVKESPGYARGGDYSFKVGGPGLTVKLLDHISEAGLAGQEVHAYEKGGDGSLVWKTKRVTDGGGLAKFDLEGLGEGKTYVFNAQPYGYWVKSEEVTATGWYSFRVGTTLLTLQDSSLSQPLSNQRVIALEKLSNGNLRWERETLTDALGQARFDLTGLGKGATYLFKAVNPFGDGKDYFSNLLTWRGAYLFSLESARQNTPDQTPPEVAIAFPGPAAAVSKGGFALYGSASDDKAIKSVRALLTLPSGAVLERPAVYQSDLRAWRVDTGALDTAGPVASGTLAVRVVATDTGLNEAEARVELSLLADTTPPVLTVLSHQDGGMVPMGGFVVSGRVTDDTLGPRLEARVEGGGLTAAEVREVEVSSANGAWAVRVAPETTFSTAPITLTLTARDGADNRVVETLHLQPTDDYQQAWHVLRRVSFGATPGQTRSLVETGVQDYLARQLVPGAVDDSAFTQRSASWLDRGAYLSTDYLRHAVYSQRQLQEVMTWFWENHFNTTYGKHNNPEYEYREQEGFRAHALGNFRDLLEVSAKSPAMLYSLDGVANMKNRPNENYARELFELNTLGITGGYSQQDVVEAARAFTGWTVVDGQFAFNAGAHDGGAKTVLGMAIPAGGGLSDGEAVLDLVAVHPSTASFICGKLVTLFVSDTPVQALAQRCAATFLRNVGATDQMAKVVWAILSSEEFLGGTYRGAKVKTPLELVVGLTRNLAGETGGDDLALELQRLEMGMFVNPLPTGYAEVGKPWISTGMLMNRVNFLDRALNSAPVAGGTGYDLGGLMANAGLETAEGVVGRMLDLILGPTWTRRHWDMGMSLLTESGSKPYWHWATESEHRLRSLGKGLSATPEYQFQ